MWPLEKWQRNSLVRVGSQAVELWQCGGDGAWTQLARDTLPRRANYLDPSALVDALRVLVLSAERRTITVLLESALAPVMLIDTGGALWNDAQVDGLFRHRFELAYGGPRSTVPRWNFRSDQRFGQREALVFGVAPAVQAALDESFAHTKWLISGVEPALAWGLRRTRGRNSSRRQWLIWPEQDRRLAARMGGAHVDVLNPAVLMKPGDGMSAVQAEHVVTCELVRLRDRDDRHDRNANALERNDVPDPITLVAWHPAEAQGVFAGRVRLLTLDAASAPPIASSSASTLTATAR